MLRGGCQRADHDSLGGLYLSWTSLGVGPLVEPVQCTRDVLGVLQVTLPGRLDEPVGQSVQRLAHRTGNRSEGVYRDMVVP